MKKQIHAATFFEGDLIHSSFNFEDATIGQLCQLNAELDLLKGEILDRIDKAPKDYEIKDFGEEDEE